MLVIKNGRVTIYDCKVKERIVIDKTAQPKQKPKRGEIPNGKRKEVKHGRE